MYRTVLNDREITELCSGDRPLLYPFVPEKRKMGSLSYGLGHFGYDIRISGTVRTIKEGQVVFPATAQSNLGPSTVKYFDHPMHNYVLKPGDFFIAGTLEYFCMPPDVVGLVKDKSTLARLGLAVQNTVLEPGWEGFLTVEVSNHGPLTVILEQDMPIAQVLFFRGITPDVLYSGRYQGQQRGTGALSHGN